jgi:hypothetical protein
MGLPSALVSRTQLKTDLAVSNHETRRCTRRRFCIAEEYVRYFTNDLFPGILERYI